MPIDIIEREEIKKKMGESGGWELVVRGLAAAVGIGSCHQFHSSWINGLGLAFGTL